MAAIVKHGTDRNLTNAVSGGALVPDPTERRFLTFVNELGGVHTIIVEAEHAATDAETLLKWFESTRAQVSTSSGVPGAPGFVTPEQVISRANEAVGIANPEQPAQQGQPAQQNQGGGY